MPTKFQNMHKKCWRHTDYLGLQGRNSDLLEVTRFYTLIRTIPNLLIMLETHYWLCQAVFGTPWAPGFWATTRMGEGNLQFQSLQPQGSLSGVQALDLMRVNQIWDVSDKKIGAYISVLFNEATFHNSVSDKLYCQEQFFLFIPFLPPCFYSSWIPFILLLLF